MKKILAFLLLLAPFASAQVVVNPGGGGGAVGSGTALTSCTSSILYADAGSLLKCDPASVVNGSVSTAGRSILTIRDTISGASTTSNFLNVTGAFPATLTTETAGIYSTVALDNDGQQQAGVKSVTTGAGGGNVNTPLFTDAQNTGTYTIGSYLMASGAGTTNIGVWGVSTAGTNRAAGYFTFGQPAGPGSSAALIGDNGAVAANIFEARDNGAATSTTAASANVTILDGAQLRLGNEVLTGSTMTPTIVGEVRSVTHSYAWTNAMVTALGASLTGDINVAVLPAKTQVNMAYIVIDTPDTSANALTVSCGDTGAGATNYVNAGDAKAAANTVYGDNITGTETGTSLFSTFFITNYLPSYTATTTVSCRFTKTTTNLNTVTGSTGRVILTTTLLP